MKKQQAALAAFLLILFALAGCRAAAPADSLPAAEIVTLRFRSGDSILQQQDVEQGSLPMEFLPELPEGLLFFGWNRPIAPAEENADYYGIFAPELSRHVPYLFLTEEGLLHPDSPITHAEFTLALEALAEDGAKAFFPAMERSEDAMTAGEVRDLLLYFFPKTAEAAMADYEEAQLLTRAETACILNTLLGRQETITTDFDRPIYDLSPKHPRYADLMEAAADHEEGTRSWDSVIIPTGCKPGWKITEGCTRLYDEDGYLVTNTRLYGNVFLDADGCCSTADPDLDILVRQILAQLQEKHPYASRSELLRYAYIYSRDSFYYIPKDFVEFGTTGWENDYALTMFRTGTGNCYYYAAAFSALARGLGYDAEAVSGALLWEHNTGEEPHSWVILQIGDESFYCDPESEMNMRAHSQPWNLYKIPRAKLASVGYREPEKDAE